MLERSYRHYSLRPGTYPFHSNYAQKLCIKDFCKPAEFRKTQICPEKKKLPPIFRNQGNREKIKKNCVSNIPKYETRREMAHPDPPCRFPMLFGEDRPCKDRDYTSTGILGNDRNKFPSTNWQSEKQLRYRLCNFARNRPEKRPQFLITALDHRSHNPQSACIFHIRRINQKPICDVYTSLKHDVSFRELANTETEYNVSFHEKSPEPRKVFFRNEKETVAEGIVPFNSPEGSDVRSEMLLPVCDSTTIPSAPNPHKYLARKRKLKATTKSPGVFYPQRQHTREPRQLSELKLPSGNLPEKISISSLLGSAFTRKKFISPPSGSLNVEGFDGGANADNSIGFAQQYLPFVKIKAIV